jgi:alkylhydroperoxidase family enzyme
MYDDGTGQSPSPIRLMAYNSAVLSATYAQSAALWHQGLLEDRLKELMRIRSAQVNGCDACAAAVKDPDVKPEDIACMVLPSGNHLGARETAALRLVETLAMDHHAVDEEAVQGLLDLFSPAEIVELVYWGCVMLGQHRFHHVFRAFEQGDVLVSFDPDLIDAPMRAKDPVGLS